jgi:transposase
MLIERSRTNLCDEKRWEMYSEIVRYKKLGYKKAQIARKLLISRPTVIKYFDMNPDDYQKCLKGQKTRSKKTDIYEKEVIEMLKKHADFTSAQIFDRLLEKYLNLDFCESTLRGSLRMLREKYEIPKIKNPRHCRCK